MEAGRQGADSYLLNLLAISSPPFVYLSHFTVVSHQLNKAMRSLFGDQGAEVSLGVKTETNQESLSGERNGGTVPQCRMSSGCAGVSLLTPSTSLSSALLHRAVGSKLDRQCSAACFCLFLF